MSSATDTFLVLEPYIQRLIDSALGVTVGGRREPEIPENAIQLIDGNDVRYYPYNESGLISANTAAATGNTIYIPNGTITLTAAISFTAGVTVLGQDRVNTIFTSSGSDLTLVTVNTPTVLENFTLNYTFTGDTFGAVRAIRGTDNAGVSIKRVNATLEITGNASTATAVELDLYNVANEVPTPAEDCFFKCFGQNANPGVYSSGHRTGAQLLSVVSSRTIIVRNLTGIALNTQDEDGCNGLYLRSAGGSLLIAYDCYGLGNCGSDTANTKGILVQASELHNCKGEAFGTLANQDAIGIDLTGTGKTAYTCTGIANVTSGEAPSESIGIAAGAYTLVDCIGIATGDGTVDIYGISASNTSLVGGQYTGSDADIFSSSAVSLSGVAYTSFAGGGTITYLTGDRAGLGLANVFTAAQTINVNSATALLVEQDGVKDDTLVVDTEAGEVLTNGRNILRYAIMMGGG